MNYNFSEKVKELIIKSEWSNRRNVDLGDSIARAKEIGIDIFPSARSFLQEFSGLTISNDERTIKIESDECLDIIEKEDVYFLNRIINCPLYPVGYGDRMMWFLSKDGRALSLYDEWLVYYIYQNIEDLFEATFFQPVGLGMINLKPDQIPPNYRWTT